MAISNDFGFRPSKILDLISGFFSERTMVALSLLCFLCVVGSTLLIATFKPAHNWDLLAYVAIAAEPEADSAEEVHAIAYGAVKDAATAQQFGKLTEIDAYRVSQFENPEFFSSMFPMYRVKLAYVEAMRVLGPALGWVNAATFMSVASAGMIALIILFWSSRQRFLQGLLVVSPVLLLVGYGSAARDATPDLFMAVFSLAAIYFVCRDKPLYAAPFLLLTFLVRPDGILLMFALLLAALLVSAHRLTYLAIFLVCVILYFPISSSAGHPGWWAHFYFTNVEIQNDMRGFAPAFEGALYLKGFVQNSARALQDFNWPSLLLLFVLGFAVLLRSGATVSRGQWIAVTALVLCLGGKFVTFPIPEDRVYLPYMLPLLLVLMEIWRPDFSWMSTARIDQK